MHILKSNTIRYMTNTDDKVTCASRDGDARSRRRLPKKSKARAHVSAFASAVLILGA